MIFAVADSFNASSTRSSASANRPLGARQAAATVNLLRRETDGVRFRLTGWSSSYMLPAQNALVLPNEDVTQSFWQLVSKQEISRYQFVSANSDQASGVYATGVVL